MLTKCDMNDLYVLFVKEEFPALFHVYEIFINRTHCSSGVPGIEKHLEVVVIVEAYRLE